MSDDTPLIEVIKTAMGEYYKKYGFQPERIHLSPGMERVVMAYWTKQYGARVTNKVFEPLVMGLEVVRMTKSRAKPTEFWLSAERGGQVYGMRNIVEPHEVGATKIQLPGEIILDAD